MPILFRPLETAPEFYTRESEERFRRELENYLLRLSSEVNGASSAQSTEASLSSKRESLILSPTGEKTYSVNDAVPLERSYYMGTKTVASTTASMAGGGAEHWVTPTSWTARQADEWAESGGEFSYSGAFPASGSRRFLVSYTSSFSGYTTVLVWSMLARITKKPDGGSHAAVAGSSHKSNPYGWFAYIVYNQAHRLSCSSIVEIESGDVISFQYGNTVSGGGTPSITRATSGDGIVLTIIPADISP